MHASDKQYDADYIELVGRQPSVDFHDKDDCDDESTISNNSDEERQAMLHRSYSDSEAPNERRISLSSATLLEPSGEDTNKKTSVAKTLAWQTMASIAVFLRVLYHSLSAYAYLTTSFTKSKLWLHRYLTFPAQALPSLIISVVGLIMAGVLMDNYKTWDLFMRTPELFILVPILLNLKGNLEMNLAARFSTSANLGDLDHGPTRRSLIVGNLALLQVQALVAGAIAGVAAYALGLINKPGGNSATYFEGMYMISSSMISAAASSAILGVFMCGLILLCRKFEVDPDNVACPMASASGDIVTLLLLGGCALVLSNQINTIFSTILFIAMVLTLPLFGYIVWKNKHVKPLLFVGWVPILIAMVISSLAGMVLEKYVAEFKGVALLTPVLIGLAGNLGSIYASRISTSLHGETKENHLIVEYALLAMNVPIQIIFLISIWAFRMGDLHYNAWFFFSYFTVTMICTWICLKIGKYMTFGFWKMGYDPDNYVLPYLTASIDLIGTILLVLTFSWLTSSGADDMALNHTSH